MSGYIRQEGLDIREFDIEREALPFDGRSFSTVLFTEMLKHLRMNPLETLRKIQRVTTDDGTLVLTTPNFYSIINIGDFILGRGLRNMDTGYEVFKQL
ncbi:class I SAM-dependent methyltransferase [Halobacteriales archaeon Cl-PHB]